MSQKEGRRAIRVVLPIRNTDCVARALGLEKRLEKLDGVKEVHAAVLLNKIFGLRR